MKFYPWSALALASASLFVSPLPGAVLQEDFNTDPTARGWQSHGDASLFAWADAGRLEVTWDSARPNSYFALPLGTILGLDADFAFAFDLELHELAAGNNPEKPNPFQLSLGLIRLADALQPGFWRGSGFSSPNLLEFSFFPDPGDPWMWGPSVTATMIDYTGTNWASGGFGPFGLVTGQLYRVQLRYTAANRQLAASVLHQGQPVGQIGAALAGPAFLGFQLDHFAICSYTDAGQDPAYAGSIFARGFVDNVELTLPASVAQPITGGFDAGTWVVHVPSAPQWRYTLERSVDLTAWNPASSPASGTGATLSLVDTNAPASAAFYRVVAAPAN